MVHLSLEFVRHILLIVSGKVSGSHFADFIEGHEVVEVPFNTILVWIRVVLHGLIHVVGKVHCHWVPATVFKVDKNDLGVVGSVHQKVGFETIVVAKSDRERLVQGWDESLKVFLIPVKQEGAKDLVDGLDILGHALACQSPLQIIGLVEKLGSPFVQDVVNLELFLVHW